MQRLRVAVLVSGCGSNLQAIIDATSTRGLKVDIACVISNRKEAFGLERARKFSIEDYYIGLGNYPEKEARDNALFDTLVREEIDLIVLAGYLAILPPKLIKAYKGKIINIHPSLLPKHGGHGFYGIKVHESVIKSGDPISGATTHFVEEGIDTGRIIYQMTVDVEREDTAELLARKVLKVEHLLMVETLEAIVSGKVKIGLDADENIPKII